MWDQIIYINFNSNISLVNICKAPQKHKSKVGAILSSIKFTSLKYNCFESRIWNIQY